MGWNTRNRSNRVRRLGHIWTLDLLHVKATRLLFLLDKLPPQRLLCGDSVQRSANTPSGLLSSYCDISIRLHRKQNRLTCRCDLIFSGRRFGLYSRRAGKMTFGDASTCSFHFPIHLPFKPKSKMHAIHLRCISSLQKGWMFFWKGWVQLRSHIHICHGVAFSYTRDQWEYFPPFHRANHPGLAF